MTQATNIDEVIELLEGIIQTAITNNDPLGFFAVLYQKVTKKVNKSVKSNFFDDNERMERLDVIFANRYLAAYFAYQIRNPTTESWDKAFQLSTRFWPITLQHLLMGINAHISLDLGIAAAATAGDQPIESLKGDFDKINEILASLVDEVQRDLARFWPMLTLLLQKTKQLDDLLINISMELLRDDAWQLALQLAEAEPSAHEAIIAARDEKVTRQATMINYPGWFSKLILAVVRLGERGKVAKKIELLRGG